jgi:L-threonylcarbamoyladenylate synthase
MEIIKINPLNPEKTIIKKAVTYIEQGKIIIHPTETVYGIAADYENPEAIKKCFLLKKRTTKQPFSIMVKNIQQILQLSGIHIPQLTDFLSQILPGPVTVLVPRKKKLQLDYWNSFLYLGFRLPDHSLCHLLLSHLNRPIITTSTNFSGEKAANSIEEIPSSLRNQIDLILDGGETKEKLSSTVIKIDLEPMHISLIREGALPWTTIQKFI